MSKLSKKQPWQIEAEEASKKPYKDFVEDFYCICCDKKLNPLHEDIGDKASPSSMMWNDCTVDRIACGYGSRYDGDVYFISLCDDCIEKKFKKGILVWSHDYMGQQIPDGKNDPLKQSRRNNKLRGLLNQK